MTKFEDGIWYKSRTDKFKVKYFKIHNATVYNGFVNYSYISDTETSWDTTSLLFINGLTEQDFIKAPNQNTINILYGK